MIINFKCNENTMRDSIITNSLNNKKCQHSELEYSNNQNIFFIKMKNCDISATFKITKPDFIWKQIEITFIDSESNEYIIPEDVGDSIKLSGVKEYQIKLDENKLYNDMLKVLEYNRLLENQCNVRKINMIVFQSYMKTLKAKELYTADFGDRHPEDCQSNLSFSICGFYFYNVDTYKYIHENDVENWNFTIDYFKFSIKQLVENKTKIIKTLREFEKNSSVLQTEWTLNKKILREEYEAKVRAADTQHSEKFQQLIQKTFPENLCDTN